MFRMLRNKADDFEFGLPVLCNNESSPGDEVDSSQQPSSPCCPQSCQRREKRNMANESSNWSWENNRSRYPCLKQTPDILKEEENMPWDSVEVGLAGGEETVNFGPRNESGSSLYQVDTLASVSPRGEVKTNIHTSVTRFLDLLVVFIGLAAHIQYLIYFPGAKLSSRAWGILSWRFLSCGLKSSDFV